MASAMIWLFVIMGILFSGWNSYAAGMLWENARRGYEKFVAGSALAAGFAGMFYAIILIFVGLGYLSDAFLVYANVFIGLPLISVGIVITVDSIRIAIETRRGWAIFWAIWNSLATLWNIFVWVQSFKMFMNMGGIKGMLSNNEKNAWIYVIIALIATVFIVFGLFKLGRKNAGKMKEMLKKKVKKKR